MYICAARQLLRSDALRCTNAPWVNRQTRRVSLAARGMRLRDARAAGKAAAAAALRRAPTA